MYLNGISHGLLPHPLPPTHPSAHTTLSAALGISQWAYPSPEVCADENRKKKRVWCVMEKEEGRCEVREMKREEGGEGEDVEPWSQWWMREKMQVDGCSPPLSPGCGCDSSRKNVRMGRLVRRDIDGTIRGEKKERACMCKICNLFDCLFFVLWISPVSVSAHMREKSREATRNIRQVSETETERNHRTVMTWVQQWEIG